MFKEKDVKLLKEKGIDVKDAEKQIQYLRKGFPFMKLAKAANINQGIKKLDNQARTRFIQKYEENKDKSRIKFIPASGAATRMFKALFEFDELFRQSNYDPKILSREAYKHVKESFDRIKDFAFYPELEKTVHKSGTSIADSIRDKNYHIILSALLSQEGMNYGNLPKGLLAFHSYGNYSRTAVEEHLAEGAGYAENAGSRIDIHLTVSPEHRQGFEHLIGKVLKKYEDTFQARFNIEYSVQKPGTDTLAIDDKGEPFRESDGSLHFRPGGHGALLDNLNDIESDIIFIKNIDNVCHDRLKDDTVTYKKVLAGVLLEYQEKVFNYLRVLEKPSNISGSDLKGISRFVSEDLGTVINEKLLTNTEKAVQYLYNKLNRPIRVCGMVVNSGEPGGGPFWTIEEDGSKSLQIVESSQIDMHDPEQAAMLNSATHFNPVDLVCGIRDFKGKKFNLMNYRDPNTGFISKKFKNGKPLKALELPGLWNGSMSNWNTIFIEVPVTTFTPVKTVYDLLRPEHQNAI